MKENLQEANYDCTEKCDECGNEQMGTMFHAHDAMGLAIPVLWVCHRCQNPPRLVGLYRNVKRRLNLRINKIRYYVTTTAEEREARRVRIEKHRARIAAVRAERGLS